MANLVSGAILGLHPADLSVAVLRATFHRASSRHAHGASPFSVQRLSLRCYVVKTLHVGSTFFVHHRAFVLLVLARPERVPENPSGSVPDMSHVLLPHHAPPLARRPSPSPSPPRLTVAVCRSPPPTPLAVSPLARALPSPQNSLSSSQRRLPYSHSGRTRRRRSCRRGSSRPRRRAWP